MPYESEVGDDEQVLVEQAQRTPEAFALLYDRYFPPLYRYVASRVQSVAEAEDLVSLVFLKALEKLPAFRSYGAGSFGTWLFRIAYSQLVDHYRKQRWRSRLLPLAWLTDRRVAEEQPESRYLEQEQGHWLRSLIQQLPERQQQTILLKFFGSLRNREIALVLGLSEQAVAIYLHRGLQRLAQFYEAQQQGGMEDAAEAFSTYDRA